MPCIHFLFAPILSVRNPFYTDKKVENRICNFFMCLAPKTWCSDASLRVKRVDSWIYELFIPLAPKLGDRAPSSPEKTSSNWIYKGLTYLAPKLGVKQQFLV